MQINVKYLDNLKCEASFDDFKVLSDQPVRYKGDGTAPGPFDYFLASSAMCAAYFVKVYCNTRNIPTDGIIVTQNNIVDPENRYKQDFHLQIELPDSISEKDKKGILASMDRCTVKRVIQNQPGFLIEAITGTQDKKALEYKEYQRDEFKTQITGKDCTLEETITNMRKILEDLGIKIEIASWRNPVPHVWSVHIRDADSPMCYTNGKGATKDAALCSALGEYLERISNNYFYNDYFLGEEMANAPFVHYPNEKWFELDEEGSIPAGLMDDYLLEVYNPEGELTGLNLVDTNSGNFERGVCAVPFTRFRDSESVYIPVNLIGNLFVSNGMSAGNTIYEARVQCLSEIFERAVKNQIIREEMGLPDVPRSVIEKYPHILEGIKTLEEKGFPIVVKDASLGGIFPVLCVTLLNPKTGGVFASFGAHPKFEVALERSLTELLQGRSFEGLNEMPAPTFNSFAVTEHNNIVDHFIDSTGVVSWKFFSAQSEYEFVEWNFSGDTHQEFNHLMEIFKDLEKEVYIADYQELGCSACRILVPDYSEIYPIEDLVWDNNNRALEFRQEILNLHSLEESELEELLQDLEESELDDYMPISELIGVAFDEHDAWARLTVGELKALSLLKLQKLEEAKHFIDLFLTFNDSTPERRQFFQLLGSCLDIEMDEELTHNDYEKVMTQMYGEELYQVALNTLQGEVHFPGLTPTDMNLTGLNKHQKLIESYRKLQAMRSRTASL